MYPLQNGSMQRASPNRQTRFGGVRHTALIYMVLFAGEGMPKSSHTRRFFAHVAQAWATMSCSESANLESDGIEGLVRQFARGVAKDYRRLTAAAT